MLQRIKTLTLRTGEQLTYWRSASGVCTIDVALKKDALPAISSTADTFQDALLTLAARFKTLGIELENLGDKTP